MGKATPCTWKDESICEECSLSEDLNCRYDDKLVSCFRSRHIPFRLLGFAVTGVASLAVNSIWPFLVFALVTVLNFTLIETWYLCRHCPFYSKDGRTLYCITLKGLPRLWNYDPAPIRKPEQYAMMAVGGFIDLFPIVAGAFGVWVLISEGAGLTSIAFMIALTLAMLIGSVYLGRFLADSYCAKCVNLSCVMNKVPKAIAYDYLRRNPSLLEIWQTYGYEWDEESTAE
ncbi:MAG: hypothetical protein ACFFAX_07200 [Promethearchaeota archaeon]